MKRICGILLLIIVLATLSVYGAACTPETGKQQDASPTGAEETDKPLVEFRFNTGDVITVELYPDEAPITVANFLTYVREGFYKGKVIHRVASYVVQGGGFVIENYRYTQVAATHPAIKGEFAANGVDNHVSHTAGAISMARTTDNNSATSQFFFCPIDYTGWDGNYAAFGHVVDQASLDAIKRMSRVDAVESYPTTPIVITSVRIVNE